MTEGRHYHGITTLGLIPTVFGGWNNGSLASIEQINYCSQPPKWTETKDWLKVGTYYYYGHKKLPILSGKCSIKAHSKDRIMCNWLYSIGTTKVFWHLIKDWNFQFTFSFLFSAKIFSVCQLSKVNCRWSGPKSTTLYLSNLLNSLFI